MDAGRAVRAMLGDPSAPLESLAKTGLALMLAGRPVPFADRIDAKFKVRGFDAEVGALLRARGRPFSAVEADREARGILERRFARMSVRELKAVYLDYFSPSFENLPPDVVFTTLHLEVAAYYGDRIIAVTPSVERGVDMNFWNKKNLGVWTTDDPPWKDLGEFADPVEIPASDIAGYQFRLRHEHDAARHRLKDDLDLALFKAAADGTAFVLAVDGIAADGRRAECAQRDSDGVPRYCRSRFDKESVFPPLPASTGEDARVLGIVARGGGGPPCALWSSLPAVSTRAAPSVFLDEIAGAAIDGSPVRFYPAAELAACPRTPRLAH